eukprot:364831-Chlamydomonas_euryale.AAC.9
MQLQPAGDACACWRDVHTQPCLSPRQGHPHPLGVGALKQHVSAKVMARTPCCTNCRSTHLRQKAPWLARIRLPHS